MRLTALLGAGGVVALCAASGPLACQRNGQEELRAAERGADRFDAFRREPRCQAPRVWIPESIRRCCSEILRNPYAGTPPRPRKGGSCSCRTTARDATAAGPEADGAEPSRQRVDLRWQRCPDLRLDLRGTAQRHADVGGQAVGGSDLENHHLHPHARKPPARTRRPAEGPCRHSCRAMDDHSGDEAPDGVGVQAAAGSHDTRTRRAIARRLHSVRLGGMRGADVHARQRRGDRERRDGTGQFRVDRGERGRRDCRRLRAGGGLSPPDGAWGRSRHRAGTAETDRRSILIFGIVLPDDRARRRVRADAANAECRRRAGPAVCGRRHGHRPPVVVGDTYHDDEPSDTFTAANEIHVPVGQPVRFELQTADVIHSLWVPELGGKID